MYSKLEIYGNCDLDYVWSKVEDFSDSELSELQQTGINNIGWTMDTTMLANFNEDITGKPEGVDIDVYKYLFQRREAGTNKIEDVAITKWGQIKDWSCQSNKIYEYLITPVYLNDEDKEIFGQRIVTSPISTDWKGVSIIDLIPTDQKGCYKADHDSLWIFGGNIEAITLTTNNDVNFINTYNKFPREHRGKINYLTASISCLIGDIFSCDYTEDNIAKIEAFREFCNNGKLKLFKDYKGNVIPCSIRSNSDTSDGSTIEHQTTVTFEIIQLAAREDVLAFSEVI